LATNCTECLEEVKADKRYMERMGNVAKDGGGTALAHEGVRQKLQVARLDSIDGARRLRLARSEVLESQRSAEWAEEETTEEKKKVEEAKKHLVETEEDVKKWSTRSEAKLNKMQKHLVDLRKGVNRTKLQLKVARAALFEGQAEVARAEDLSQAGARARKVMITLRVVTRLKWKLQKQKEEVRKAQKNYEDLEADSEWFKRGLQKEVQTVEVVVKDQEEKLQSAQAMEHKSRKQLQEAKDKYRESAAKSQNLTAEAARLQRLLLDHPLPTYVPPEVLEAEGEEHVNAFDSTVSSLVRN